MTSTTTISTSSSSSPAGDPAHDPAHDPAAAPCGVLRYETRADGPRVVPLGPDPDDPGQPGERGCWVAVDRVGRVCGGLVTGGSGAGRSSCLEAVALGLARSGEWTTWYTDGDPDGESSPLLSALTGWAETGAGGALAQLDAIEDTMRARAAALAADPGPGLDVGLDVGRPARFVPSPRTPALLWIIAELPRLTTSSQLKDQRFTDRVERVVRAGRKYGIAVAVGASSLLMSDFGNSTPLRAYLGVTNRLVADDVPPTGAAAVCRVCGCSEEQACVDEHGTPCAWAGAGVCTRCAGPVAGHGSDDGERVGGGR